MTDQSPFDDPQVAALLALASASPDAPMPGEDAAVAAFVAAKRPSRRLHVVRPSESGKLFAAAVFGGVVVISGAAAAATGSLPIVQHHSSHAPKAHTPDATD